MRKTHAQEITGDWFKDHKANIELFDPEAIIIKWAKPGTGIYAVTYIIRNNYLYVSGDIGEAVYCWSSAISPQFLSTLNLDYFASKCQASEAGRGYPSWDDEQAKENLMDALKYHIASNNEIEESEVTKEMVEDHLDEQNTSLDYAEDSCSSKDLFYAWIGESGYDLFGSDWYENTFGQTIDMRCEGHLIGIRMAVKQLQLEMKLA
jgi:hypothetical protein